MHKFVLIIFKLNFDPAHSARLGSTEVEPKVLEHSSVRFGSIAVAPKVLECFWSDLHSIAVRVRALERPSAETGIGEMPIDHGLVEPVRRNSCRPLSHWASLIELYVTKG